jgi:hypothetical protein
VLPNLLSHQCPDFDSLKATLERVLRGELGCASGEERTRLMEEFFAPLDDLLACDRIVDMLDGETRNLPAAQGMSGAGRLKAWRRLDAPRIAKVGSKQTIGRLRAPSKAPRGARKFAYPEIPLEEIRERLRRFEGILERSDSIRVESLDRYVYRVSG